MEHLRLGTDKMRDNKKICKQHYFEVEYFFLNFINASNE